ncbi:hypothetical protein J3F84DRAFT_356036 [Trichoderma pleuroticola]
MRRAGVTESQISHPIALFPVRYVHSSTRHEQNCCWLQAKKTHAEKHGAICPTLAPNMHLSLCRQQARPGSISDGQHISTSSAGQTRGLGLLSHSANLLGSWSAMALDAPRPPALPSRDTCQPELIGSV